MSVAREQNKTVNVVAQQSLLIDVVKNNKIGDIFLNAERVAGIDDLVLMRFISSASDLCEKSAKNIASVIFTRFARSSNQPFMSGLMP